MRQDSDASSGNRKSAATEDQSTGSPAVSPPAITLPKGGGAIRGMGEKFAANPVTGTGSMSVPIATSPGRSGFGPQLSLSYDSGAGNGSFGFGWSLSIPSITRKTDKGLPQYRDGVKNQPDSDVFILSGAEDLVPVLDPDGSRYADDKTYPDYTVHRYRPRIEGLFARIERWTHVSGDVHWRSISRDNILTLYGKDANARIADPADPRRIFSWLICETRDDKGNAVVYEYKEEDGVDLDLSQAHERNRWDGDNGPTANRYLKHIYYGNRTPLLDDAGKRPLFLEPDQYQNAGWMFEVVFDYGEHDANVPTPDDDGDWSRRNDPFSSYRAGFEVRTYRLCQRVLMFHHFAAEPDVGAGCLVRSTDFHYAYEDAPDDRRDPIYSFLLSVTPCGYRRQNDGYLKRSLPPVEFEYSLPVVQDTIEEVDAGSLENLPIGLDGEAYQWTDLHGEGLPGILTEQGGAWFYKRNLSPLPPTPGKDPDGVEARFAPVELVDVRPNLALGSGAQFMDLAGDGQPDLVVLEGAMPGLYEHDGDEGWQPFRPFTARLGRDMRDPNLKFVDLDGDSHADVLITEDDAFVWHPSLDETGFGPAERVAQALDEERGPRLVFADGEQSIYLADMSGDGLIDLARIRNGEVCYWPNLGYGRFGAKVTMDESPRFDNPDQFEQRRVRLADIDGSGTTDIIYLHGDGVRLYFNQSGNSWGAPRTLHVFPHVDNLATITAVDLLGNGTACLVWSSPLPGDAGRPMRYVNLMGAGAQQKPHLLVKTVNNLGAETRVTYGPSTKFYLQDKYDGTPWITRLPFPVHVVERVETHDYVSRNHFVTTYTYHHGYFDGEEREFRGFGMVEQRDTEAFAALTAEGKLPPGDNVDLASHVPPVLTRTWFHTGVYVGRDHVSDFFGGLLTPGASGDRGEYYRERAWVDDDEEAKKRLLPDTILPDGLTVEEEREAARALKGMMLRQEVYALDGVGQDADYPYGHPYTVAEQNFSIRCLQTQGNNRHAVFFTHPREAITYHYEREEPADPRIQHVLTLEVDDFGNVLKEAAIGYGRRQPDTDLFLEDQAKQTLTLITYTENRVTRDHDTGNDVIDQAGDYRTPLPCETRTYELTDYIPTDASGRYQNTDFVQPDPADPEGVKRVHIFDSEIQYEDQPTNGKQRRLIEQVRTLYRRNDLTALLPLGEVQALGLPGESYKLALTPGLLAQVYQRGGQLLLPDPADVLGGMSADRGGYIASQDLKATGAFPDTDHDDHWWFPSGRVFYSPDLADTAAAERDFAEAHFFLPHRFRDPFGETTTIRYDGYDLLLLETEDPLHNKVTAGERDLDDKLIGHANDYRVLQPALITDPNRNRSAVAFDALGLVVGTAVMGKAGEGKGDALAGFNADLDEAALLDHLQNPLADPHAILQDATTRLLYDLFAYHRTRSEPEPQPAVVYTLARETHAADLAPNEQTNVQHSFSYSDGFGREIQKKIQAEPGPLEEGGPDVSLRWVGSGWTIFNNKGKPVRQFEPFFSATHGFEFGVEVGVSPILFYDPVERVVATLHPNHTWEKVVFDPWQQATYDVNDTVLNDDDATDPKLDDDVKGFFERLADDEYLPTWYEQRIASTANEPERIAADKAAVHRQTPTVAHFDTLGRPFLTIAHNRFERNDAIVEETYPTRIELDIEGNQRAVRDAIVQNGDTQGRVVMRYDYDLLGNRIHQDSMDAGERWMLSDVAGNPIRAWDSRDHTFRTAYDQLRRPVESYVREGAGADLLVGRTVYGESQPDPEINNLRGQVVQLYDQAGVVTSGDYDFKGNLLSSRRQLAQDYKTTLDWSGTVPLEAETFTGRTRYDALNRPVQVIAPHSDQPGTNINVIQPVYNEANLLEQVNAWLNQNAEPPDLLEPATASLKAVTNINYNAKGQRELIVYGNGVGTTYIYDPLTFRLVHLLTQRAAVAFPADCPEQPPAGWPGCQVQNLHYTHDPAGNITHIRDDAQQTIYFKNKRVEPSASYTYDALYRLIEATGREHLGQIGGAPIPHSHDDALRMGLPHPSDGNAMGTYTERYVYDAVGNFLKMQHHGSDPAHPGWTRSYDYQEPSQLEPAKTSNRLSSTAVGSNNPITEHYAHDPHGNMTRMPHLGGAHPDPNMHWDYRDQLHQADLGGGGKAYFVYDAAGQRVRKVHEHSGATVEERMYLGGFEIYRKRNGSGLTLERETLHIMDDQQRIALVETRTQGTDPAPSQLIRYQFGNHLGSASLELDDQAQIISYEEYFPYGSTSYQAVRSQTETPKRYRYTGKERDEESGFYYHGARYYVCWLGRWMSPDPSGLTDGTNRYAYSQNKPVERIDPTGRQSGSTAQQNRRRGIDAAENLQRIFEAAGLEVRMEQTAKGGRGGSRIDMIVEGQTIESKLLDVNRFRTKNGISEQQVTAELLNILKQVRKHEQHVRTTGRLADASFREALAIQLENATPAEAEQIRDIARTLFAFGEREGIVVREETVDALVQQGVGAESLQEIEQRETDWWRNYRYWLSRGPEEKKGDPPTPRLRIEEPRLRFEAGMEESGETSDLEGEREFEAEQEAEEAESKEKIAPIEGRMLEKHELPWTDRVFTPDRHLDVLKATGALEVIILTGGLLGLARGVLARAVTAVSMLVNPLQS